MSEDVKKVKAITPEQEIKALSEISSLVQTAQPDKNLFEDVLKALGKIVDYRSASLFLFSKEGGKLEEICTVGRKVDLIGFVNFEMGNGISAWVAKHRRPILLNNLRKSKDGTHTKSFISVPLLFAKEILGVINIAHDEPESYTKRDIEILIIAASILSLLVERMLHTEALETKSRAIEVLSNELESSRKISRNDIVIPNAGNLGAGFVEKISNPLAIIMGNAQFLMMTFKSTNPSAAKRLKAIDREAANIQEAIQAAFKIKVGLNFEEIKTTNSKDNFVIEL